MDDLAKDLNFKARIAAGEDALTEFKPSSAKRAELRRSLVAFANSVRPSEIGVLFVGVLNNGSIQGELNPDKKQKTIRSICDQDCYPPVYVQTKTFEIDRKKLIAILVPYSNQKPHFSGHAFIRRGSETFKASEGQYEHLIASRPEKCGQIQRWEANPITVVFQSSDKNVSDNCRQCRIERCDAHVVKLYLLGSGRYLTVPLPKVLISFDDKHHCPQLIVEEGYDT